MLQVADQLSCDYMASIGSGDVSALGYDCIEPRGRRRAPTGINSSEDAVLKQRGRDLASSSSRDVFRNFTIARWGIGKHLDYNTLFNFHALADEETYGSFGDDLEAWVAEKSKKEAFDAAGKLCLDLFLRLMECRSTLDGDVGVMQIATGHAQAIEGDRIRNPKSSDARWSNGVLAGPAGRALAYGIWNRADRMRGYTWDRSVPASRFYLHANFDRFDQLRGVSPFLCALAPLQDAYEDIDLTMAKRKVESLFSLAIFRNADTTGAPLTFEGDGQKRKYQVDFGRGPIVLDLDPGDDAKFLKSDSPGANSREFLMSIIMIALKSLDIPFSFFDESFTNFFGSRAAWQHYERSCVTKRKRVAEFLNWWFCWRIKLAVQDREIRIPRGLSLQRPFWEWYPAGMPWWDPVKEVNGDNAAVSAGYTSPQRVTKERGKGDWYKNIDERAEAEAYARKKGVKVSWDVLPVTPQDVADHTERDKPEEKKPPAREESDK